MAQAMKRLPIDAKAKCNGTRSGVSITRVSSVVITAAMADLDSSFAGEILYRHFLSEYLACTIRYASPWDAIWLAILTPHQKNLDSMSGILERCGLSGRQSVARRQKKDRRVCLQRGQGRGE